MVTEQMSSEELFHVVLAVTGALQFAFTAMLVAVVWMRGGFRDQTQPSEKAEAA